MDKDNFEVKFLGYDRDAVDSKVKDFQNKIETQQKDIDYLKRNNLKLREEFIDNASELINN